MKTSDWYGLGTSIVLHLLLLLAFGFMNLGATEPEPIGYVEVEFGPFAEGRPVQRAVEDQPETPEPPEPQPDPQPEQQAAPPEEAKPVNLAEQETPVQDEERVQAPETETISPVTQNNPAEVEKPEPEPEPKPVKPLGGGAEDGTTGEQEGQPGLGEQEQKTAPYQIEGLNRGTVYAPLPAYNAQVEGIIQMRITVDPSGRIVRMFPQRKGDPDLERAVREALARWRFNALPTNVPQENQTGSITFRFRLE